MKKKDRLKAKLFEFLSNPENEIPLRSQYAVHVLGYKRSRSIYTNFKPDELTEIENEALVVRKKLSATQRARVYDSLYKQAINGNVQAAKEYLDRTEGKTADKLIASHSHKVSGFVIEGVAPSPRRDER